MYVWLYYHHNLGFHISIETPNVLWPWPMMSYYGDWFLFRMVTLTTPTVRALMVSWKPITKQYSLLNCTHPQTSLPVSTMWPSIYLSLALSLSLSLSLSLQCRIRPFCTHAVSLFSVIIFDFMFSLSSKCLSFKYLIHIKWNVCFHVSVALYRCRCAAQRRDGNDYFILLIITDGIITDMPQTCEAIVNVSPLLLLLN